MRMKAGKQWKQMIWKKGIVCALSCALLLPMLIHGFYDFSVTSGYEVLQTVFLVFVVALDIIAIVSIRRFARQDVRV